MAPVGAGVVSSISVSSSIMRGAYTSENLCFALVAACRVGRLGEAGEDGGVGDVAEDSGSGMWGARSSDIGSRCLETSLNEGKWFGLVVGPPCIHGIREAGCAGIGSPG